MTAKNFRMRLCTPDDRAAWVSLNRAFMDYEITDPQLWNQPAASACESPADICSPASRVFSAEAVQSDPLFCQLSKTFSDAMHHPNSIFLFLIESSDQASCSDIEPPANDTGILCRASEAPCGFANAAVMYSVWAGGFILILDDLFLHEKFRGRGLGRQAMAFLEHFARERGFRRLQFWSEPSNPGAYAFYSAMGYQSEDMKFYVKHF